MDQNETPEINQVTDPIVLIEVTASDDGMTGYVKLVKQGENPAPATKEQIMAELHANRIMYGIKETSVEKLAARPIYNIKIEVAKGLAPIHGTDGIVTFYVVRDSEYRPVIDQEGFIDYKNLDYFQMVKKDQTLAEITAETKGTEGMNIYGAPLPAKDGKMPSSPVGKNTHLIQEDTLLVSDCDGVIRFLRDTIDVNDILKISGNVDVTTGNLKFTGDISIDGDVGDGFSVKSGGNVIIKGVLEDAGVEASGNVHISKGINGGVKNSIYVGGNLKCKYIEHAHIHVEGDISADYIIDSDVTCMGDIVLSGSNELVVGGEVRVMGILTAKDIGSETGRNTKIEVIGKKIMDTEAIEKLTKDRDDLSVKLQMLTDNIQKLNQSRLTGGDEVMEQLALSKKQIVMIRELIDQINAKIQQLEKNWTMEYPGAIVCKRKMYQGVKIHFGEERFQFQFDNIEHCRIFWADNQIIQGTL